jgi:hypothetical protein
MHPGGRSRIALRFIQATFTILLDAFSVERRGMKGEMGALEIIRRYNGVFI